MMLANLLSGAAPAAIGVIAPVAMGMPVVAGFVRLVSPKSRAARQAAFPVALSGRALARHITARSTRSYTPIATATSGHVRSVSPSSRRR